MCAALVYLRINKVEEGWLMIMENVPQHEKSTLFLDYFIQQQMENQNVPIEMWNINKRRQWTNSAVQNCNSKLNNIIGKHQPNVFLQIHKRSRVSFFAAEIKGTWAAWSIPTKDLCTRR